MMLTEIALWRKMLNGRKREKHSIGCYLYCRAIADFFNLARANG